MDSTHRTGTESSPEKIGKSDVRSFRSEVFSNDDQIEIRVATNAGACFGVVRAIKLGRQALAKNLDPPHAVVSLGPLIHKPKVVGELQSGGLHPAMDPAAVPEGSPVVLRS